MHTNLKELIVSGDSKIIKYILVLYPWVYDSCKTTVYSHAMDFAFKAVIETVLTAPAAAILWTHMYPVLLCSLMPVER